MTLGAATPPTTGSTGRRSATSSRARPSTATSSARPASPTPTAVGGLDAIGRLPFTEKDELRADGRRAAAPIGAHLAAPMAEVVRVYSTSGTTGSPSYIPLTRADLAAWITISSRSYAASGVAAGERIVTTYNAGPFVAGVALEAFHALGLCQIPVGSGPQRAAARRGRPGWRPTSWR